MTGSAWVEEGGDLLFLLYLVVWGGDAAAYYVGSLLGKHPLTPRVSPRKTVEGAVAGILAGVLERHGNVLKSPAPQVYLDEYADNSINFAMTYWVEMSELGDSRRVKSDLLLMIDAAFTEAGISIPFPQRDVHLSTGEPVPVRIVDAASIRPTT